MFVLCPGIALGDYNTPLNNNFSFEGDDFMLYKTFNNLFGVGQVNSNNELLRKYGFKNEGPLQVTAPRFFAVSGMFQDNDGFVIMDSTSGKLLHTSDFPHIYPLTSAFRNFLNRPLEMRPGVDLANFSGGVEFIVTNYTGNGGQFFSNLMNNNNLVGSPSHMEPDHSNVNYFRYLDVTRLIQEAFGDLGFDYTDAWLIAYEDRACHNLAGSDLDYNDGVFLVFSNIS